jgi:hypothetical protein
MLPAGVWFCEGRKKLVDEKMKQQTTTNNNAALA